MNSKQDLKKKKILNILSAILGVGILAISLYLGVTFYNRGVYVDDHNMGGYITGVEIVMIAFTMLLLIGSIVCFKIAQSRNDR